MSKKTYRELGKSASYKYDDSGISKKIQISNTLRSIDAVNGDSNDLKNIIRSIERLSPDIETIDVESFANCPQLTSIHIPTTLKDIGDGAFKNCEELTTFTSNKNNGIFYIPPTTGNNIFENCGFKDVKINVDSSVITDSPEIGDYLFKNNKNLESVTEDVIQLGNYMFDGCNNLTSISFSANADTNYYRNTGEKVFNGCTSLSVLRFPRYITSYYHLNDLLLSGSSVLSIFLPGFLSSEAIYATGGEVKEIPSAPSIDSTVSAGKIYRLASKEDSTKILYGALINKIPLIVMRCSNGCGYCDKFKSQVINNNDFITELSSKSYSIIYVENRAHLFDSEHHFDYVDNNGNKLTGKLGHPKQIIWNRMEDNTYISDIRLKVNEENGKILKILKLKSKFHDLFADDNYTDITRSCSTSFLFNSNKNSLPLANIYTTYPIVTYIYMNNSNELIMPCFNPIKSLDLKKLLNGEVIETIMYQPYTAGTHGTGTLKLQLIPDENFSTKLISPQIATDKLLRQPLKKIIINNTKYVFIERMIYSNGNRNEYNNKFYINPYNIYIQFDNSNSFTYKKYTPDLAYSHYIAMDKGDYQTFLNAMEENIFETNKTSSTDPKPEQEDVDTLSVYGNCWGLQLPEGQTCKVYYGGLTEEEFEIFPKPEPETI